MYKLPLFFTLSLLLSGCMASPSANNVHPVSQYLINNTSTSVTIDKASTLQNERVHQCRNELEALHVFDAQSYSQYQSEFKRVSDNTQKYLKIKKDIGPEINELAMPKYQFAIRDICFRIRTDLAKAMISVS